MKRPPITGIPTPRPRCPMCDKPLSPYISNTWDYDADGVSFIAARAFDHWRGYRITDNDEERFCTVQCAERFARLAYRAGYRINHQTKGRK